MPAPAMASAVRRRIRTTPLPPPSTWHLTLPGAPAALELRWAARARRAPILTSREHAAAVADSRRPHTDIEVPIGCALCGEDRMQPLLHPRDLRHTPPRWDYHVVRCPGCGLLYRHPGIRPERLGDLYSGGAYSAFLDGRYSHKRERRYRSAMRGFGALLRRGRGRRLLDFGCGTGTFLDIAHRRRFECYGVDLAADAVEVARSKPSGANVHHGSPLDVPEIAAGGFDVITMWSVLAHLAEPVDDVTMLRRLLAPGGVLILLTVNAESLALKRAGSAWQGFTKNHLKFFSPATLRLLFDRSGFAAAAMPPWYGDPVEAGRSRLSQAQQRRLRAAIDQGNRGNMLRAAAFVDTDGPARWGLDAV